MDSPFWPGEDRAGDVFSERAFLDAMVAVESAWAREPLDLPTADLDVEAGGNAVIPLVAALRQTYPDLEIHTGLTSQDVSDTALMLLARDAVALVGEHLARAVSALDSLNSRYGTTPLIARTLTQWALPITFDHKLSAWRAGLTQAIADLDALTFPAQVGGPVGLLADDRLAATLGLDASTSWHTNRRPLTRIGDALVSTTDACGHIARDVLTLSRSEVGEVSEGRTGGSSSMPHKANPVLSVLIHRASLTTPNLAATLHLCSAQQVDERADGAWHAEWDTLRHLARRTVVAASQTADLLAQLEIHPERMRKHLEDAERSR